MMYRIISVVRYIREKGITEWIIFVLDDDEYVHCSTEKFTKIHAHHAEVASNAKPETMRKNVLCVSVWVRFWLVCLFVCLFVF